MVGDISCHFDSLIPSLLRRRRRRRTVVGVQASSEHLPPLLRQEINDGVIQRIDNKPVGHILDALITGIQSQVDPRAVVAAVPLLQLEHAPPEIPRPRGRQALAAPLGGAGAGLAAARVVEGGGAHGGGGGRVLVVLVDAAVGRVVR